MKRYALLLVVAVLLAGCTALPSGEQPSEAPPARGLVIEEAQLENRVIPATGSTKLVLRLANTQPRDTKRVGLGITNSGEVSVSLDTATSDPVCQTAVDAARTGAANDGATIPAASQGVPTEVLCVFDVSGSGASLGTYPLTATVTYENTLTMQQDSPKITFDPERQVPAARTSRTYSNGELSMTVSYPPQLPTGGQDIQIDTTVRETGGGRMVPGLIRNIPGVGTRNCDDRRCVFLTYQGSFMGPFGYATAEVDAATRKKQCRWVNVLEGDTSATARCVFAGSVSGGPTTHSLRITADYRYRRVRELPIEVVESVGGGQSAPADEETSQEDGQDSQSSQNSLFHLR
ncbi:MAG: hypothetical protein ABEI97_00680 [Candidatus Nanohaloarchaea archaeon]